MFPRTVRKLVYPNDVCDNWVLILFPSYSEHLNLDRLHHEMKVCNVSKCLNCDISSRSSLLCIIVSFSHWQLWFCFSPKESNFISYKRFFPVCMVLKRWQLLKLWQGVLEILSSVWRKFCLRSWSQYWLCCGSPLWAFAPSVGDLHVLPWELP